MVCQIPLFVFIDALLIDLWETLPVYERVTSTKSKPRPWNMNSHSLGVYPDMELPNVRSRLPFIHHYEHAKARLVGLQVTFRTICRARSRST